MNCAPLPFLMRLLLFYTPAALVIASPAHSLFDTLPTQIDQHLAAVKVDDRQQANTPVPSMDIHIPKMYIGRYCKGRSAPDDLSG